MKSLFTLFSLFILIVAFSNLLFADYEFSFQGNSYKLIEIKKSWIDAAEDALAAGGHLVHINSEEEQNYIFSIIKDSANINPTYTVVNDGGGIAYVWIGATDLEDEGNWRWDGTNSGEGDIFWQGQGAAGTGDGNSVEEKFQNWGGKIQDGEANEPDNYFNNQNSAAIALEAWPKNMGFLGQASEWNDINSNHPLYYIIEIEGSTKVNEDKSDSFEFYLSPNPATDFLYISDKLNRFDSSELSLINLNGERFNLKENNSSLIDIRNLPIGTYFLLINIDSEIYKEKFIIRR